MKILKLNTGMKSSYTDNLILVLSFLLSKTYIFCIFLIFFILIFSSETSNNTYLAITRNAWHSIYLYRTLGLQASDFLVLSILFLFILMSFLQQKQLVIDKIIYIYLILFSIPFIGSYYNFLSDKIILKYLLYDFKTLLYLLAAYLLSNEIIKYTKIKTYNLIVVVFILWILGGCFDTLIVHFFHRNEYPSILGIPAISGMISGWYLLCVLIKKKISPLYLFGVIGFYVLLYYSMVRLSGVFWLFVYISLIILYEISTKFKGLNGFLLFLLGFIFLTIILYLMLIFYSAEVVGSKSMGFLIRQLETFNYFYNNDLFTLLFGNGWGAGWKEIIDIEQGNIYSRGNIVQGVNFVWHSVIGGYFYKQGLFYFLFTIFFVYTLCKKVKHINIKNINQGSNFFSIRIDWLMVMMLPSLLSPGILKQALLMGIVLSCYRHEFFIKDVK
jgi:hypothetical protein